MNVVSKVVVDARGLVVAVTAAVLRILHLDGVARVGADAAKTLLAPWPLWPSRYNYSNSDKDPPPKTIEAEKDEARSHPQQQQEGGQSPREERSAGRPLSRCTIDENGVPTYEALHYYQYVKPTLVDEVKFPGIDVDESPVESALSVDEVFDVVQKAVTQSVGRVENVVVDLESPLMGANTEPSDNTEAALANAEEERRAAGPTHKESSAWDPKPTCSERPKAVHKDTGSSESSLSDGMQQEASSGSATVIGREYEEEQDKAVGQHEGPIDESSTLLDDAVTPPHHVPDRAYVPLTQLENAAALAETSPVDAPGWEESSGFEPVAAGTADQHPWVVEEDAAVTDEQATHTLATADEAAETPTAFPHREPVEDGVHRSAEKTKEMTVKAQSHDGWEESSGLNLPLVDDRIDERPRKQILNEVSLQPREQNELSRRPTFAEASGRSGDSHDESAILEESSGLGIAPVAVGPDASSLLSLAVNETRRSAINGKNGLKPALFLDDAENGLGLLGPKPALEESSGLATAQLSPTYKEKMEARPSPSTEKKTEQLDEGLRAAVPSAAADRKERLAKSRESSPTEATVKDHGGDEADHSESNDVSTGSKRKGSFAIASTHGWEESSGLAAPGWDTVDGGEDGTTNRVPQMEASRGLKAAEGGTAIGQGRHVPSTSKEDNNVEEEPTLYRSVTSGKKISKAGDDKRRDEKPPLEASSGLAAAYDSIHPSAYSTPTVAPAHSSGKQELPTFEKGEKVEDPSLEQKVTPRGEPHEMTRLQPDEPTDAAQPPSKESSRLTRALVSPLANDSHQAVTNKQLKPSHDELEPAHVVKSLEAPIETPSWIRVPSYETEEVAAQPHSNEKSSRSTETVPTSQSDPLKSVSMKDDRPVDATGKSPFLAHVVEPSDVHKLDLPSPPASAFAMAMRGPSRTSHSATSSPRSALGTLLKPPRSVDALDKETCANPTLSHASSTRFGSNDTEDTESDRHLEEVDTPDEDEVDGEDVAIRNDQVDVVDVQADVIKVDDVVLDDPSEDATAGGPKEMLMEPELLASSSDGSWSSDDGDDEAFTSMPPTLRMRAISAVYYSI